MFKGAENLLSVNKDTVLCWQNIKSKCQASETAKYTSIYTTETDVVMSAQRHDAGFRGKFYISHGFMGEKKNSHSYEIQCFAYTNLNLSSSVSL